MKKHKDKNYRMPFKHKVALFTVYLVLFLAIFGMIDYYAYDILNPIIFIGLSIVSALVSTYYHLKHHQKTKADELAEEIEEIL
jgi:uncharacterized ion transporter superfamily protein YfcC